MQTPKADTRSCLVHFGKPCLVLAGADVEILLNRVPHPMWCFVESKKRTATVRMYACLPALPVFSLIYTVRCPCQLCSPAHGWGEAMQDWDQAAIGASDQKP